jgi:hypothetical protein
MLSGKDGTVRLAGEEMLHVSDWRLRRRAANKAYAANDTGGGHKRVAGAVDCTGRLVVQATDSERIPMCEGAFVELELHVDGSGENYFSFTAIVDSLRLRADVRNGGPQAYVIEFSNHGPIAGHGLLSAAGVGGG